MIISTRYLTVLLIVAVNLFADTIAFSANIDRVQLISKLPTTGSLPAMIVFNDKAYFLCEDGDNSAGLWISDGTETGTKLIKSLSSVDVGPFITKRLDYGPGHGSIPVVLNGNFYFFGPGGLWKSDGTKDGTVIISQLGRETNLPRYYTELNSIIYIIDRISLWRTDGTPAGTWKVASLIDPSGLVVFHGKLYFQASDPLHDMELWVSDGTAAGTGLFKDINPYKKTYTCGWIGFTCTDSNSLPRNFMVHNNTLYFSAVDGVHGREL